MERFSGLYIGLMSGTSLDGVDGVIARLGSSREDIALVAHCHRPFEPSLRDTLAQLNASGPDEIHRSALAGNAIAAAYADVVNHLLASAAVAADDVQAIGAHGQTVRHRPGEFDGIGYTVQLLNGARLAELAGVDVICDFRSRDVAAGGQGAPLVPAFHHAIFHVPGQDIAVLNIGGIANLTLLHADGRIGGYDCGPGNVLLDLWINRCLGQAYDRAGEWAAQGEVDEALLHECLRDSYLRRKPPKSTGRDHYHAAWLNERLGAARRAAEPLSAADVQATLTRFTAVAVRDALLASLPHCQQLLVCGGGALNHQLMTELQACLRNVQVTTTAARSGVDAMHVEALAFAWFAHSFKLGHSANCTDVTGATGPRILGALYPAQR